MLVGLRPAPGFGPNVSPYYNLHLYLLNAGRINLNRSGGHQASPSALATGLWGQQNHRCFYLIGDAVEAQKDEVIFFNVIMIKTGVGNPTVLRTGGNSEGGT